VAQDPDQIFAQIERWPERFGTRSWRKRAHRELDSIVHERFIVHATQTAYAERKQEHGQLDGDGVSPEWELFNAARANRYQLQKFFEMVLGAFDGAVIVAALFGAFWLFMWLNEPSRDLILLVCAHTAIIIAWAVLRFVSWRNKSLEKRKLRFEYPPAEEDLEPRTYRSDRITAIELEGRKYRSSALLSKAMGERQERLRKEDLVNQVLSDRTDRAFGWIANVLAAVACLGVYGLLEQEQGIMPFWLSIVLMCLGGVGVFLVLGLRDRLLAPKDRCRRFSKSCQTAPILNPKKSTCVRDL
jgi:cation transport ATPase